MPDEMYTSFAQVYDLFMEDTPYAQWADTIHRILTEEGCGGGLVCELGCGTGRMTRELAARGYDMTGIDLSPDMLAIAREMEPPEGARPILYLNQDMRGFELYGTMAAIVSVCDCINYITDPGELQQVFALVQNYLDPDGIFIFDINSRYKYQEVLAENTFSEMREDACYVWENSFDPETQENIYDLELFVREDESGLYQRFHETHIQRAYGREEIRGWLEHAGLFLQRELDLDTGGAVREDSQRICFVARKRA